MKKSLKFLFAGVLVSALCAGFVACNEPDEPEPGLGEVIPGIETQQATGTIIGSFRNGFTSFLVQVDEEFPIGGTISSGRWAWTTLPEREIGTYYLNVVQVQSQLPIEIGNRISFSFREYRRDRDVYMFSLGPSRDAFENPHDLPICVVTKYEILDN